MRIVVLVGSRHRGWKNGDVAEAQELIGSVLSKRQSYYGQDMTVVSLGCDLGFGKEVKTYCEEHGIKFVEFVVYFNGPREKDEYAPFYVARHASLIEVGSEFHVTVSKSRMSNVEDLVSRVKESGKPYRIYSELGEFIEELGELEQDQTNSPSH